jgi:UDP-2,4-diacetamido-2,4,6-trideoxy-beta-L-altropyranose hydrolase
MCSKKKSDIRVVIFSEGGSDARGLGHLARCVALCQAFEEKGCVVSFAVDGDPAAAGFLRGRNAAFFRWQNKGYADRAALFCAKTDIAVIDSYTAGPAARKRIAAGTRLLVSVVDRVPSLRPPGIVIRPAIRPAPRMKAFLSGSSFALLRKEFWDVPGKAVSPGVKVVAVSMGGSDVRGLTPLAMAAVAAVYPQAQMIVCIGAAFPARTAAAIRGCSGRATVLYHPDAAAFRDALFKADIAVTAGGQTLFECSRAGVAAIAVTVAGNQREQMAQWVRAGCVYDAGGWDKSSLRNRLSRGLRALAPAAVRIRMASAGMSLVDGQGARRAAAAVLAALEEI